MSDGVWIGIVAALVFGVPVVLVVWEWVRGSREFTDLYRWAADNGWSYTATDGDLVGLFVGEPFGEHHDEATTHVLRGQRRGHKVMVYEYAVTTPRLGGGLGTDEYRIVTVRLPSQVPWLQVAPRSAGRWLLDKIGVRDLQLDNEDFNRAFHIQTGSKQFASDVLHPQMMAWLLADSARRRIPFRSEQGHLVTWTPNRRHFDLRTALRLADHLIDVVDLVPELVWRHEYVREE